MASIAFTCAYCGLSGRHVTVNNVAPLDEPSVCDQPACRAKYDAVNAEAALVAAETELAAAQQNVAALKSSLSGTTTGAATPHTLTVAELKALAADNDIDLGDSTRKVDIRDKVVSGLPNVAALRDLARREGIALHDARSRTEIIAVLSFVAPVEEEEVEEEESVVVSFGRDE